MPYTALFPGAAVIGTGDVVGALLLNDRRDIKRTAKMEINGIPFKRPIYKIITAASYIADPIHVVPVPILENSHKTGDSGFYGTFVQDVPPWKGCNGAAL